MTRTIILDDDTASKLFLALERSTEADTTTHVQPPSGPVLPPVVVTPPVITQPPAQPVLQGSAYKVMEINWNDPNQPVMARSAEIGGFGKFDTLVIHFRTSPQPGNGYGRLSIVEFGAGGPSPRNACLSRTPGDMNNGYKQQSIGPTFVFLVGTTPDQYAAVLPPNTDWYCNVQNDPNSNETAFEVQVTLAKPKGT